MAATLEDETLGRLFTAAADDLEVRQDTGAPVPLDVICDLVDVIRRGCPDAGGAEYRGTPPRYRTQVTAGVIAVVDQELEAISAAHDRGTPCAHRLIALSEWLFLDPPDDDAAEPDEWDDYDEHAQDNADDDEDSAEPEPQEHLDLTVRLLALRAQALDASAE